MGVVAATRRSVLTDMRGLRGWEVQWGLDISQTNAVELHCTRTVRIPNALQ